MLTSLGAVREAKESSLSGVNVQEEEAETAKNALSSIILLRMFSLTQHSHNPLGERPESHGW